MDEFAEYIYQRRPEYRHLSTGDISAQKELRKQLKCKDFKWFMAAVAWDVPKYYPPVEPPPAAWGEVRSGCVNPALALACPPLPAPGAGGTAETLRSSGQQPHQISVSHLGYTNVQPF